MEHEIFDLRGLDEKDLIRWNKLMIDLDDIFDNAEKNFNKKCVKKWCGKLMRTIKKY